MRNYENPKTSSKPCECQKTFGDKNCTKKLHFQDGADNIAKRRLNWQKSSSPSSTVKTNLIIFARFVFYCWDGLPELRIYNLQKMHITSIRLTVTCVTARYTAKSLTLQRADIGQNMIRERTKIFTAYPTCFEHWMNHGFAVLLWKIRKKPSFYRKIS